MDSDRILVMDKGTLAEYDTPAVLSTSTGGILSSLIDETGQESAAFLRDIASGKCTVFE
eukprot:CAMPEP_0196575044 /NCGR_PEP_ID=MMETSP1081-20130531/4617_1 /TAXON_ID=36882 /ORGANISM="Pyramimonas amylifera, Strain CCMP720" /LENGTH=58 /DNA_ID=CAMNT_0041893233 /DNA_START=56 /DNA_END=232 /DNA_ORIENTATION=-